jgi:ketosteroid isomerase-like protein
MPLLYLALRKVETRRPTVTRDDVRAWLNAYVEAWRTYDPAAIGALFTEDATYAYHPWNGEDDLVRGRDAIVANWLEEQDKRGSWEAQYRPLMVEGERAVATGTTRYANGKFYWNLFVLRFGGDGRCAEFVEWYMTEPPEETSQ